MKLKYFLSLAVVSLCSISAVAQKIETSITWLTAIPDAANNIIYNPSQKLSIADFKGTPDAGMDAVAITSSGFMFKAGYHSSNGKATLSVAVYCSFDKQQSWMKEKGKNPYILAHEQHHFDISYLNTLLFTRKVKQATFRQEDYMQQLKDIYQEVIASMRSMQRQYDEETGNGVNTIKQEEWNKKINEKIAASAKDAVL
jgi:hypothetical protein